MEIHRLDAIPRDTHKWGKSGLAEISCQLCSYLYQDQASLPTECDSSRQFFTGRMDQAFFLSSASRGHFVIRFQPRRVNKAGKDEPDRGHMLSVVEE